MLSPGCTVGNLKIGKLLGRGAMGEVYSGEQVTLRRPVAIKRIAGHLADDPEIIQRFAREAQCVAKVNSQHVVAVYEFGQYTDDQNDKHYLIIMELVEGAYNLKTCIGTEITWQQASSVIMQVADGLATASEHDVIHRDIKPDNIMLNKKGIAKLADFGLAKSVDSTAMTMEGTLMGTPNYMPPEACRGEMVTATGDIYSLGATWYHLITGMPLFTAANTMAILRAHCDETPKHISEVIPDIPKDVAEFVMSCVAKDPADRPADAEAIVSFISKVPGVPQKVPELVRIASAAKAKNDASGSTMATVADGKLDSSLLGSSAQPEAATVSAGMAETLVTGAHENPDQAADTLAAAPASSSDIGAQETIPASAAAETIAQAPAEQKSKTGLIIGLVVVAAAIAGGVIFALPKDQNNSKGQETKQTAESVDPATTLQAQTDPEPEKDPPGDPDSEPAQDPVDTTPDPVEPALDIAALVKPVNTALAQKEYSKAQTAYDELAKHSQDHGSLQTQITDGKNNQASLKKDLQELDEKGHFYKLAQKLPRIETYPELKAFHKEKLEKLKAFNAAMEKSEKDLDTTIKQKQWSKAAEIAKQIGKNPDIIGPEMLRKMMDSNQLISMQLNKQQAVAKELKVFADNKQMAALKEALGKASEYPELSAVAKQYADAIQAKEAQVQADLEKTRIAINKQQWSDAQAALDKIEVDAKIIGKTALNERQALAEQLQAGASAQIAVAKELKAMHDAGQFIALEQSLDKAKAYPDLAEKVKTYSAAIQADAKAKNAAYDSALKEIAADKFLEAQAHLDEIGEDPQKTAAALIEKTKQARSQLKEAATTYFKLAVEKAVAGVQEQSKEGLQKSSKALRDAAPAAKVAGLEEELKAVTLKLVEIIEKRSE